jgi:hypothetical protein
MTLEQMEKRLRAVEDIEQIRQLQHRYMSLIRPARMDKRM